MSSIRSTKVLRYSKPMKLNCNKNYVKSTTNYFWKAKGDKSRQILMIENWKRKIKKFINYIVLWAIPGKEKVYSNQKINNRSKQKKILII